MRENKKRQAIKRREQRKDGFKNPCHARTLTPTTSTASEDDSGRILVHQQFMRRLTGYSQPMKQEPKPSTAPELLVERVLLACVALGMSSIPPLFFPFLARLGWGLALLLAGDEAG